MPHLILLRHGQSMWNHQQLFTGWVDVPLTNTGINEATQAGLTLADTPIDCVFTSTLIRAQQTAMIALAQHHSGKTPVLIHPEHHAQLDYTIHCDEAQANTLPTYQDWRLNERHYGELQCRNKVDTAKKYGDDQVKLWRRSYDTPPPAGESLALTAARTLPCFNERILPALQRGQHCLVAAHGNSLRSIVMHIEQLSQQAVLELEIPTGEPWLYQFSSDQFTRMPVPQPAGE